MAVHLRAALKGVFTFSFPMPPAREEIQLNEAIDTISHSPEVLHLFDELRRARESDAVTAADLAQAESVLADLVAQRAGFERQIKAQEDALALSGSLPEGPFPEERNIQDVDRRIRVARSRVQIVTGNRAESLANVNRQKAALSAAFAAFVTNRLAEVTARYRKAVLALRQIYGEQFPWTELAQRAGIKVPSARPVLIVDPNPNETERFLLDSRDYQPAWLKADGPPAARRAWQEFSPLRVQLTALHAEVAGALGELRTAGHPTPPKATREGGPQYSQRSQETFAMTIQAQAAAEAISASPAEAGAQAADVREYGI
jgi:hypothetical protein